MKKEMERERERERVRGRGRGGGRVKRQRGGEEREGGREAWERVILLYHCHQQPR